MIFKNDSASTIDPFSLINLTGISVQENGQYWLTADKPDSAANFLLAVTGRLKVRAGKYGDCQPLCPVFQALYDSGDGTPANEENWGPDNGTHLLKKNFGGGHYAVIGVDTSETVAVMMETGSVILRGVADAAISGGGSGTVSIYTGAAGSESDSGDNVTAHNLGQGIAEDANVLVKRMGSGWVIVPVGAPVLGKTDGAITKGSSGTVSIWSGTPGSETDTTNNITAYNRFADIASGKWVWCANNGDGWYIVAAECA